LLKSPMATAVTMAPISRSAFWKAKLAKHVSRVNAYVRLQSLPC
jgi:G:T-mismatch repair DNA endonuclease (very short patch repair protein)